jgi:CRISPR-associated protein Csm3
MQLTHIGEIQGHIQLISGLHIGSGNTEMHIGGTDNPVIKNPFTREPYIPGSSIKGKMRSLLEWRAGVVQQTDGKPLGFSHIRNLSTEVVTTGRNILKLFGGAPEGSGQDETLVREIGPTRLAFWDCNLDPAWVEEMEKRNLLLTEIKSENSIDRIKGVAVHPRNTERVPAGARFRFRLTIRVIDQEDLIEDVLRGLRLLELTGLGGSGSRGYGKLKFMNLVWEGQPLDDRLAQIAV